jgi:hypothetical protein
MLDREIPPDDLRPLFDQAWQKLADATEHCYEVLASCGFRRDTAAEFERDVVRAARVFLGIAEAVRSLADQYPDQIAIPFRVRRDLESAVLVVRALVDRCGYSFLSQTDFEEQVKAKLDAHDQRTRIPLLQVAYARSLWNGAEEDTIVDALAEEARSLKLRPHDFPPKTNYASMREEYERLFANCHHDLAVGREYPKVTEPERITLARASSTIRKYAQPETPKTAPIQYDSRDDHQIKGAEDTGQDRAREARVPASVSCDDPLSKTNPPSPPPSDPPTHASQPLDPAVHLRSQGKTTRAKLVEFMKDRASASIQEIADHVHGDRDASEQAIRTNISRTNEDLLEMGLTTRFRTASGMVFKDQPAE